MKVDMHTHSKYSHDSLSSVDKIFRMAKKKGIDGISLNDHQSAAGWRDGLKAAKKHKMFFIKGQEIRTYDDEGNSIGDTLCYFLNKEIRTQNIFEVVDAIDEQDALLFMAHPFDKMKPHYGSNARKYMEYFDGIEVFNAATEAWSKEPNKKALAFAKKYKFPFSAGSDCHVSLNAGNAYVEAKASGLEDFRKKLEKNKVEIFGKRSSRAVKIISQLAKLRRVR